MSKGITCEGFEARHLLAVTVEVLQAGSGTFTSAGGSDFISGTPVHVRASAQTLADHDPLKSRYSWDFNHSSTSAPFETLEGWNAAHVYSVTSLTTYTITLTIDDPNAGIVTDSITVDIGTDNRAQVYIDAAVTTTLSGADGDGHNSANPIGLSQAMAQLDDDQKLLFQSGDVFNLTSTINLDSKKNVVLTSWGSGQATLKWTGSGILALLGREFHGKPA